ncbi:MAG: LytR C-terminal domain-containing protein [Thermoleophilia bacterium]|jgi:hypothetical protein|nr:LytR C-terminal domain-containing protein [Thermoleophilia bacterium]
MSLLTFIAVTAVIAAVFAAIGLLVVALLRRRDIRRLKAQLARPDGVAAPVEPERQSQLQGRDDASQGDLLLPGRGRRWLEAAGVLALVLLVAGAGWWIWRGRGSGSGGGTDDPPPATTRARTVALPPDRQVLVPPIPPAIGNKAAFTVAVLNASGIPGAARGRVAPLVEQAGYTLGEVGDGNRDDVRQSVVMWARGKKDVALNVAHDLGVRYAPPLDGVTPAQVGGADAVVVVGRDLARG